MDISSLDKAEVLAALYNGSQPLGLGFLQHTPEDMTTDEARSILESTPGQYFDYLKGRVMKIDLSSDNLSTSLYNRENGENAAEKIISSLTKNEPSASK